MVLIFSFYFFLEFVKGESLVLWIDFISGHIYLLYTLLQLFQFEFMVDKFIIKNKMYLRTYIYIYIYQVTVSYYMYSHFVYER